MATSMIACLIVVLYSVQDMQVDSIIEIFTGLDRYGNFSLITFGVHLLALFPIINWNLRFEHKFNLLTHNNPSSRKHKRYIIKSAQYNFIHLLIIFFTLSLAFYFLNVYFVKVMLKIFILLLLFAFQTSFILSLLRTTSIENKLRTFIVYGLLIFDSLCNQWEGDFSKYITSVPNDFVENFGDILVIKGIALCVLMLIMRMIHMNIKMKVQIGKMNGKGILISKAYMVINNKIILEDINLELKEGKMYLLEGSNGSGKTMLLRLISGLTSASSGLVQYSRSYDFGIIIETPTFMETDTAFENLKFITSMNKKKDKPRIDSWLQNLDLHNTKNDDVKKYSLGMKQRLAICQVLLDEPDVLLLDEPFNGIDEDHCQSIKKMLCSYTEQNKIIVVVAHNLPLEMRNMFDFLIKMDVGKVLSVSQNNRINI